MDEKIVKEAKDLVNDCISRQAAIDAIRASTSKYTGFMEMEMYTDDDAVEAIEGLPSAQPEIIRCKDCKHNPKITWFGCPLAHCSETQRPETAWCWKAERREDLPAQPEQRWIPCSERLPEDNRQVLIYAMSVHYALAKYDEMREADGTYKKQWVTFDAWKPFYTIKEVIAWMPLPEPYKEDDYETD